MSPERHCDKSDKESVDCRTWEKFSECVELSSSVVVSSVSVCISVSVSRSLVKKKLKEVAERGIPPSSPDGAVTLSS